ncbi:hypothetical protein ACJX0J_031373, partial [Zea mays]
IGQTFSLIVDCQDRKFITIAEVLTTPQPNISWRRSLIGPKLASSFLLISRPYNIHNISTWGCNRMLLIFENKIFLSLLLVIFTSAQEVLAVVRSAVIHIPAIGLDITNT